MKSTAPTINKPWPKPSAVLEYFERSVEALAALRRSIMTPGAIDPSSQFYSMLPEQAQEASARLRQELDHEVTLLLTASMEATFQVDFWDRVHRRLKDSVSRKMRRLRARVAKRRSPRVLVEELLEVWQEETGHGQILGQMKQLIQFRHWLAHGRYWVQKSGLNNPDPYEAWRICQSVFQALPALALIAFP